MLHTLFNHRSKAIYIVEALGIVGLCAMAWRMAVKNFGWFGWLLFAIVVAIYAFIRFCTTVRWYKPVRLSANALVEGRSCGGDARRYEGIELQFKKAMSPTAYVILLGSVFFQIFPSAVELAILVFMLIVIAHVNVILLYLKHRDKQELPVNYFSGNKNSQIG